MAGVGQGVPIGWGAAALAEQGPHVQAGADRDQAMILAARVAATDFVRTPAQPLPPSDVVPGFEIICEVGRGGMGVVYKAWQLSTDRVVALKVMLDGPFASHAARIRFQREVANAARCRHEGIVGVLESGETPTGQLYYAMMFIPGVRLDEWAARVQRDVPAILKRFISICDALDHAHACDVIHRDLKPGNILVDPEDRPHLLDFGLSKATDGRGARDTLTLCTSSGGVMGTLPYISPEQTAEEPVGVDVRADLYAVGMLLYEAMTGATPFDATEERSVLMRRIRDEIPRAPSSVRSDIPRDLDRIVLKALVKDRSRRYTSAKGLAEDLQRVLRGERVWLARTSRFRGVRRWMGTHRATVGVAALVAILAGGLLGAERAWSEYQTRQQQALVWSEGRQELLECDLLGQLCAFNALEKVRETASRLRELPESLLIVTRAEHRWGYSHHASERLGTALRVDPSGWAERMLLAELCRALGQPERGAQLEAEAVHPPPDTIEGWYVRSFATLDRTRSRQCLERCLSLDPNHLLARERSAHLALLDRDYGAALAHAAILVQSDPQRLGYRMLNGHLLTAAQRTTEAVRLFTDLIEESPDRHRAYERRALAYRVAGDYRSALADVVKAGALEFGEGGARGWHLFHQIAPTWILGRTAEAARLCERTRQTLLMPTYTDARWFVILNELGRVEEAQRVLARARKASKDPWLLMVFDCLGGQITPEALVAAANTEEHRCEADYYAGEACLLADRKTEALGWFQRCVESNLMFDPDSWPPQSMSEFELARWRVGLLSPSTADLQATSGDSGV